MPDEVGVETRMESLAADAGDHRVHRATVSASSSWCVWRSCLVHSSPGTAACAALSPCEPSRSTSLAPTGPARATVMFTMQQIQLSIPHYYYTQLTASFPGQPG